MPDIFGASRGRESHIGYFWDKLQECGLTLGTSRPIWDWLCPKRERLNRRRRAEGGRRRSRRRTEGGGGSGFLESPAWSVWLAAGQPVFQT